MAAITIHALHGTTQGIDDSRGKAHAFVGHTGIQIVQRFQFLEAKMNEGASGDEIASLGREYSELRPVVEQIAAYRQLSEDLAEAQEMLADPDMRALAEEELPLLRARFPDAERALQLTLLPKSLDLT